MRAVLVLALVPMGLAGFAAPVAAQGRCRADLDTATLALVADPCPAADASTQELRLPLPHVGLSLVLRRVEVENKNFWCSEKQVTLGAPDSGEDPFSSSVGSVDVFGMADGGSGQHSWLGKYELSIGQAMSMLAINTETRTVGSFVDGFDRMMAALRAASAFNSKLRDFVKALGPLRDEAAKAASGDLSGSKGVTLLSMLGTPARGLSADEMSRMLDGYNGWCLADGRCREMMEAAVAEVGIPGFLRLPTEVEWEYAARGGSSVTEAAFAEAQVPWERDAAEEYAVFKGGGAGIWEVKVIGDARSATPGGFYDLLGNVQELTIDPFRAMMTRGRVGGTTARGGSFFNDLGQLSFTQRTEYVPYRFADESGDFLGSNRDAYTGMRPIIGAPVKRSLEMLREVGERRERECSDSDISSVVEANCGSPTGPVVTICNELKGLETQLRDRNDQLCAASARGVVAYGRRLVDVADFMAVRQDLFKDPATPPDRARIYKTQYDGASAELAWLADTYVDFVNGLRGFPSGCAVRTLESVERDRRTAIAAQPLIWEGMLNLVRLDIESEERLSAARVQQLYQAFGVRIMQARK